MKITQSGGHVTAKFNPLSRLELIGAPTPLEYLPRCPITWARNFYQT
jgi:1-aminocyclopropane-1-carboxylate deaminase/D-cysteine desulfhydrase-like pyridoxal-dependent ACC family enzyme